MDVSLKAWISLSLIRGLGGESSRSLLKAFGSPQDVLSASRASLSQYVKADVASAIIAGIPDSDLIPTLSWLDGTDTHIVALDDVNYPRALLNISDPPILLYVKGNLPLLNIPSIAIVGSRNATPQGLKNAEFFASSLADAGLCVVSGLAHGIDAAAHRGALGTTASTLAVVGTGLDRVYPSANRALAHEIAEQGTLVSEFPIGTPPLAGNFPRRNRLISGLSLGCLVVEASIQSGSLITARLAIDQGKEVFAIPGSIHSPQSKGCHMLIKQGAALVESTQDILDQLHIPFIAKDRTQESPSSVHSHVLAQLHSEPVDLETLSFRTGLTLGELSAMLLTLELSGQVAILPGGLYQRLH